MMFFFFNDTATTEIYTLSLHDALPISRHVGHDDRLAEDDAAEDVADRPVGRAVHPLEAELLDAGLVRGDRRALDRSEEHTSELQSRQYLVCRLLLEKKHTHIAALDIDI